MAMLATSANAVSFRRPDDVGRQRSEPAIDPAVVGAAVVDACGEADMTASIVRAVARSEAPVPPAWVCGREIGNIVVVKSVEPVAHATEPVGAASDDARTRDRVARALHELGPQSAVALSVRFGLTPAAVRRHLDGLIAAGRVCEAAERKVRGKARGRGRPAKLFALTDHGRDSFPHAYDDLALAALTYLRDTGGDAAVAEFAHRRLAPIEQRYESLLAGVPEERRPIELAAALSADGYAASAQQAGPGLQGTQVCQHHCPVSHVASDFPQLCEAETEVFGRLLGTHVQRLATIAHGDGVCTTHIPGHVAPGHISAHAKDSPAVQASPTSGKVDV